MDNFNVFSFLFVLILMMIGAVGHWVHKKLRKEVQGTLLDYIFADYPGRSASVLGVFLVSSATVGATTVSAIVDPFMLWDQLVTTRSIPSICAAGIGAALTHGWSFNSGINKGAKNGIE